MLYRLSPRNRCYLNAFSTLWGYGSSLKLGSAAFRIGTPWSLVLSWMMRLTIVSKRAEWKYVFATRWWGYETSELVKRSLSFIPDLLFKMKVKHLFGYREWYVEKVYLGCASRFYTVCTSYEVEYHFPVWKWVQEIRKLLQVSPKTTLNWCEVRPFC